MTPIVLNYFGQTTLAKNSSEAIEFINTLPNITCNDATKKSLENYFLGKNLFPLNEIATTGCGKTRIFVYKALADTLGEHNAIVRELKENANLTTENALNEYCEGIYEVDFEIIKNEGRNRLKTEKIYATSKNDAWQKISAIFWNENPFGVTKINCKNVELSKN
jgi:hypothetical protein